MIKYCILFLFIQVPFTPILLANNSDNDDCPHIQLVLQDVDEYMELLAHGYINPDSKIDLFFKDDGLRGQATISPLTFFPRAITSMTVPHDVLHHIHQNHGPLARLRVPGIKRKLFFLADPNSVEEVLKDTTTGQKGRWEKSDLTGKPFSPLVGDNNVFTSKAPTWKRQRKEVASYFNANAFTTSRFSDDMQSVIGRTHDEWKIALKTGAKSTKIDMAQSMTDLTLRGLFKVFFSEDIAISDMKEVEMAFGTVLRSLSYEAINPFKQPLHEMQQITGAQKKLAEAHEKLNQFAKNIIKKRKETRAKSGAKIQNRDLLDQLIDSKDHLGKPVTENEIINQFKTYLLAGHETTSTALSWGFYSILKDSKIKEKLIAEIRQNFPPGYKITAKDLEKLPYLDQVWNENLRLNSPVPLIARRAEEGTVLSAATTKARVNQGDDVVLSVLEANRNEKKWGVATTGHPADQFHPERFNEQHNKLKHLAYGTGNRVCLGQFFANAEGKMTLAQTLVDFDLDLNLASQKIKIRSDGSYKIDGSLWVEVKKHD